MPEPPSAYRTGANTLNAHRFFVAALSACLTTLPGLAAAATQAPVAPATVMMLGSFHFENPGRDMVKFKVFAPVR
jgi:hypothetical protein